MKKVELLISKGGADPNKFFRVEDWFSSGIATKEFTTEIAPASPFFWACACGRVKMVKCLLEHGADPKLCDLNGKCGLHLACAPQAYTLNRLSRNRVCIYLLSLSLALFLFLFSLSLFSLLSSLSFFSLSTSLYLSLPLSLSLAFTQHATNIHIKYQRQTIAFVANIYNLHEQNTLERKEIVEILLKAGCSPNIRSKMGNTPFYAACGNGLTESARVLLAHGADSQNRSNDGGTALHFACAGGSIPLVTLLVEQDPTKINETNNAGLVPFEFAWRAGKKEVMKFLLTNYWEKIDQERLRKKKGFFHLVCLLGLLPVVKQLHQLDLQQQKQQKQQQKQQQAQRGQQQRQQQQQQQKGVIKIPLEEAAKLFWYNRNSKLPVDYAVKKGHTEIVEYLVNQKAPIIEELLRVACHKRRVETFGYLLSKYLEKRGLNRRRDPDDPSDSLLHELLDTACSVGCVGICKIILQSGSREISVNDSIGQSCALFSALLLHNAEVVRCLLFEMNANPNKMMGQRTLLQAIFDGPKLYLDKIEMIRMLLEAGSFVNLAMPGTRPPLYLALKNNYSAQTIESLLQHGAKVEPCISRFKTLACSSEVMKHLLPGLKAVRGPGKVEAFELQSFTARLKDIRRYRIDEAEIASQIRLVVEAMKETEEVERVEPPERFFVAAWTRFWLLRRDNPLQNGSFFSLFPSS